VEPDECRRDQAAEEHEGASYAGLLSQ